MEKTNFLYYDRLMIEYKETKHSLVYKANSDLSLYSAGYEECTPATVMVRLEIISANSFVLNGEGEFRINEHVFHLKAGDAFLIPGQVRSLIMKPQKQTLGLMAWISFIRHQLRKLSLSDYDFNRSYLCDPWFGYPKILRFYFPDHAIRRLIDQSLF